MYLCPPKASKLTDTEAESLFTENVSQLYYWTRPNIIYLK